jgi:Lipocalin-like domain
MNWRSGLAITAMVGLGVAELPDNVLGQGKFSKGQLVGTWTLVAIDAVRPDGNRQPLFGATPKGIAMFDEGGRYIISVMRSDLPVFAVNDRMQGTADENKAVSHGTITYFDTYTVDEGDGSIRIRIAHAQCHRFRQYRHGCQRAPR